MVDGRLNSRIRCASHVPGGCQSRARRLTSSESLGRRPARPLIGQNAGRPDSAGCTCHLGVVRLGTLGTSHAVGNFITNSIMIVDDKSEHVVPFLLRLLEQHRNAPRSNGEPVRPFIVGLNGVQGAGKTTLVRYPIFTSHHLVSIEFFTHHVTPSRSRLSKRLSALRPTLCPLQSSPLTTSISPTPTKSAWPPRTLPTPSSSIEGSLRRMTCLWLGKRLPLCVTAVLMFPSQSMTSPPSTVLGTVRPRRNGRR